MVQSEFKSEKFFFFFSKISQVKVPPEDTKGAVAALFAFLRSNRGHFALTTFRQGTQWCNQIWHPHPLR